MTKNSIMPVNTAKQTFSVFVSSDGMKKKINQLLGGKDGTTFTASIISAVSANPMLADCDNTTILSAALLGNSLNLSPSAALGQFFIVPYNDNKNGRKVAQFQLGYKGYIQLAIRTGQYKRLNVMAIKAGELIEYNPLEEIIKVDLIDDEEKREAAETIGYYAFFELVNGFRKTVYWSKAKMERHALRYSKGYAAKKGYTFWEKNFDEMAKKTMLRQLISKWGAMSVDLEKAFINDMAAIYEDGKTDYVDNSDVETVEAVTIEPEPAKEAEKPKTTPTKEATPTPAASEDGNAVLFG